MEANRPSPCVLRDPRPGELGHIIQRHGELYAREQGFDQRFEALVAEIAARFVLDHDPENERLWIADVDGRFAGSVMICRDQGTTARLRLFLVEPEIRGRGVGKVLINECVRFSRARGYQRITLSTVNRLHAARSLYERVGFRVIHEKPARRWSQDVVDQEWMLELAEAREA